MTFDLQFRYIEILNFNVLTDETLRPTFKSELKHELLTFTTYQEQRFPTDEVLKIDLHCHDRNSDVPDELLGRILNVPETWLPTKRLVETLQRNGTDVITITNHNNARSCYELIEKGQQVLVGCEFSVTVPDFNIGIHVLAYGFNPDQEKRMNKLRKNIYQFLQYAHQQNIPTIWAHPLYHYSTEGFPTFDFFSKMALIFERFEVLNGQRDTWQNMLVKTWIESLSPQQIDKDAQRFGINLSDYSANPYRKALSGGSDSHMGIFAGQTGTYLHVPKLKERSKKEPIADLALEAIREGRMAPYGAHQDSEKLTVAFLDYVCQIALYKEDPGLLRILLHKGTPRDKMIALFATNAFSELKNHKVTMRFIELFHNCFIGKAPAKSKRLMVSKVYKPVFDEAMKIAKANSLQGEEMTNAYYKAINSISHQLNQILFTRLEKKITKVIDKYDTSKLNIDNLVSKLEITSDLRQLFSPTDNKSKKKKKGQNSAPDIAGFLDGLSFPFLASGLILAANFTSSKVMYANRPLLKTFADRLGKFQHPKRMLWLTDTFDDKNGVSSVLQEMHKEIKQLNLPIDIMVCSNNIEPDDHLIVIKPLAEITLPVYAQQPFRVPNFNEIHNLFLKNEYDRIMCSTEGLMGLAALYLKNAYSVPAHFYIHTDWIMFARKVLNLDVHNLNRLRRFMRAYYSQFDQLFVLNTDHQKWLTGKEMDFAESKVKLTAHWVHNRFQPNDGQKNQIFNLHKKDKVLLFVGRLSAEKGIFDVIEIYNKAKKDIPELKLVIAGTGPSGKEVKKMIPDAVHMGWVSPKELPMVYASADLLILPSKFDTFSCVVLEALSCGLPVLAYKAKGPKDIIQHQKCGYLASGKKDMVNSITEFFSNDKLRKEFAEAAIERAKAYNKQNILSQLLADVDLTEHETKSIQTEIVA